MLVTATLIAFTILIVLFYFFIMSFKHPAFIATYLHVKKKSPAPKLIFGIFLIVFLGIVGILLTQIHMSQTMQKTVIETEFTGQQQVFSPDFQQLLVETYPNTQNYYFLYTAQDKQASTLEAIAKNIRKNSCAVPCTINFYDDIQAFTFSRERIDLVDPTQIADWNKAHYVFVADHYLGYLTSAVYPSFAYYPSKDAYYRQLVKKQ